MARMHVVSEIAKQRIDTAIDTYLTAIVMARDVLEHFDCYYCGVGNEDAPTARARA